MADSIDDLLNWPILAGMGLDVLRTVSKAHVYDNGKQAIIVDTNDCVFYVSSTFKGEITKAGIDALSGQQICAVAAHSSGGHILVRSETGLLHGWGDSMKGQLVVVKNTKVQIRSTVRLEQLEEHKFLKVVCGSFHSVALSDKGEVWTWGSNLNSQCTGEPSPVSSSPRIALPDTPCCDIVSGDFSSAALTRKGVIWMWGSNSNGQRALRADGSPRPIKISLPNRFVRIAMGAAHVLALTDQGDIFAWGSNDRGQVGNANMDGTDVRQPEFIECRVNGTKIKFMDVAAMVYTSAALADDQVVYIWGHCCSGAVTFERYHQSTPMPTALRNLSQALARHSGWGTHRTLVILEEPFSHDLAAAFDNEELSDCRFSVEGQLIFAQKVVLQTRSQYFRAMFSVDWKESSGLIEIGHHSYCVYGALIKYLYTGKLDISDEHLLPLVRLCHETIHERLGKLCMERIRRNLCVTNVLNVLDVAMELQQESLLGYCRDFAKSNVKKIFKTESKEKAERLKRLFVFAFGDSSSDTEGDLM